MKTTKVYQVTLFIVDLDQLGPREIREVLENTRYPNHCIAPDVQRVEERDIGEWHDGHYLNRAATQKEDLARLFQPLTVAEFERLERVAGGPDRPGRYAALVDRPTGEVSTLNAFERDGALAWIWEDQPEGPPETLWTSNWPCARMETPR